TVEISAADLSALLSDTTYAPLSGHANKTVQTVLNLGGGSDSVGTIAADWDLCSFSTAAKNHYGQIYYSRASKIFGPSDAYYVDNGESPHNNNYACSNVSWYGGMAYSIWLGGMLPTVGQWYYGACATNNSGGKAANSHCPSPIAKTSSLYSGYEVLDPIAWYSVNDKTDHVHEVGKKAPNCVGLYDVSGNLYEWCLDWSQSGDYTGGQDGVSVPVTSYEISSRALRGGVWNNSPIGCSLGRRASYYPYVSADEWGFRAAVAP
ncbi:MAG: SUMF1/EgtB/PvdO family nonheme iron enzyme, partial [Bacteroidales bacterium]|nr:SUMF1/EgtB/PvdO family nonheme iron enzyme [Bacteroidales bacterium]